MLLESARSNMQAEADRDASHLNSDVAAIKLFNFQAPKPQISSSF